jgi:hypothetical protein
MSARLAACAVLAALLASLPGCAAVKPWERDVLARPDMSWEPDALEARRSSHIHYSKEASLPGGGAGGGGCGCN